MLPQTTEVAEKYPHFICPIGLTLMRDPVVASDGYVIHTHAQTHTHRHIDRQTHTHTHAYAHTHTRTHKYTHTYTHAPIHACVHTHTRTRRTYAYTHEKNAQRYIQVMSQQNLFPASSFFLHLQYFSAFFLTLSRGRHTYDRMNIERWTGEQTSRNNTLGEHKTLHAVISPKTGARSN